MFPNFATTITLLSNSLMTAVAGIILLVPFTGKRPEPLAEVIEAPLPMVVGPGLMGGLCLLFGIIPWWVSDYLVEPAVRAFSVVEKDVQLAIFHGFNTPLLLSIITLTLGGVIYFARTRISHAVAAAMDAIPLTGQRGYDMTLKGMLAIAHALADELQNGSLHRYLLITIGVFTITTAAVWWLNADGGAMWLRSADLPLSHWLLVAVMAVAVVVVVRARSRILAVAALGMVGGGAALVFLVYGAPDLALTQLLVETLTLIIASIVLLRLPPLSKTPNSATASRWLDGLVAIGTGIVVAGLCMAVTDGPIDRQLTAFFEHNSYIAAHGRNIVNVILVDFRSLDTLGEITVVATAGLAGYALIAKRKG
jgi:multicomponent Na+:H+ antiporter subunit A